VRHNQLTFEGGFGSNLQQLQAYKKPKANLKLAPFIFI
jgi:hypothetical protein